jgi:hypothetical protein
MSFEHAVLHPAEASDLRVCLYTPVAEHDTAAKLERLLAPSASLVA